MEEVRWLDPVEERAWRALQFMHLRLSAALAQQLAADSDLSYPDYMVLVALTDRRDGRERLFELARQLGWERSRLSHHLTRMVARGLVAKEGCPSDRRGAFAVVTELGRRQLSAAAPGHVAAVRQLFVDRLTRNQLQTISEAAESVLATLERRAPDADTGGHGDDTAPSHPARSPATAVRHR